MSAPRPGPSNGNPGVPATSRHRLGNELRQLRQAWSLRLEDVAARLDIVPSTLSRIETGRAPVKSSYLTAMLDLFGVDKARRERLTERALDWQRMNWWADCGQLLPAHAGHYLNLEASASHVRLYAAHAIPGLLQTRSYAVAYLRATRPELTADQVRKLTALQLRRQEQACARGRRLRLIIDESALLRSIGARTMLGQLRCLVGVATDCAVTLQVAELARTRPVLTPDFAILSFADPAEADVVCGTGVGGQVVITRRKADVQAANAAFTALGRTAASPEDSATLIKNTVAYWERQVDHDD